MTARRFYSPTSTVPLQAKMLGGCLCTAPKWIATILVDKDHVMLSTRRAVQPFPVDPTGGLEDVRPRWPTLA
jgi:hypothetical protein